MATRRPLIRALLGATLIGAMAAPGLAQDKKPDFRPFSEVSDGYQKVVSTADGAASLYGLWMRKKDGQMLAELPRGYARQKHFIVTRIASGDLWAGYAGSTRYVYWKRFDKRMALVEPEIETRSTGDAESKSSVARHFTDRVILDVPIVAIGPNGQPVIDLDSLLIGHASEFFGSRARGANARLATVDKAKAFPQNIEVAFEVPLTGGRFKTLHYSISQLKGTSGYKPREADERIGYFTTSYRDLGKYRDDKKWTRYINRWPLQKRDPSLKLSPPKNPIVFYVEHTVPVRYRRFIRQGVEYWNKAFENIGIVDAIEVRYQDEATGAFMDRDPEDVRYNFLLWLSNDVGTAIGPSRVHPETGEILDADIVLTDGWIRHFWYQFNEYMPSLAMEGFTPETLAWLERRPQWDPRIRLANPAQRDTILAERARRGVLPYGGHPAAMADSTLLGDDEFDGLAELSQSNGLCMAAHAKAFDMAVMGMNLELLGLLDPEKDGEPEGELIDGIPDWFVGPMLADLVAHEVGHTIGLRHNFKASSVYSLEQMNSEDFKGSKPITGSVMDYSPVNINMDDGEVQGDYAMIDIGAYDFWAIEYGYTLNDKDLPEILSRVAEPELQFATDEDTWGPDPLARRYDFSSEPLDFCESRMRLARHHRERILDEFVKEGDSWAKTRKGYGITLGMQTSSINMMANWVGGAHVNRDRKGDPGDRDPIEVVSADTQRDALNFVIQNSFYDNSFGLTTELLRRMGVDRWWDGGGRSLFESDADWPVHDRIMGIQASTLTMLLNPTTLRRVYDNEFRIPSDEDAFTLPELMDTISTAIWTEINDKPNERFTAREPMVSSLRRNLQREHLDRLFDLAKPDSGFTAAHKPISNLALANLRELKQKIDGTLEHANSMVDPYTMAHFSEAQLRIEKVLDAQYIYNTDDLNSGGGMPFPFFIRPEGE